MHTSPPYKRLLTASLLVLAFYLTIGGLTPQEEVTIDAADLPDHYLTKEGYVVFRGIGFIWIADEPINMVERLTGYFTLDDYVIVSQNTQAKDQNIFRGLRINQKVRVYGDFIRESNPPRIYTNYIERLDSN